MKLPTDTKMREILKMRFDRCNIPGRDKRFEA